jgi:hypothetical protein
MASASKTKVASESTSSQQVTIEELEDRKALHVPGRSGVWDLVQWKTDQAEEPRIYDLDLARRLKYSKVYNIRKLIGRLAEEGKINPFIKITTVLRRGDKVELQEFWLSEADALKVAARSETDGADAILDEMIQVYMLARRGLLPQQSVDPALLSNFLVKLERLEASNQEIQVEYRQGMIDLARQNQNLQAQIIQLQNSHESGVIGARLAKTEINSPLSDYARIMARVDLSQGFRAHCSRAHIDLRDELEYPAGQGSDWRYLPREKFGKAQRVIRKMLSKAIKALNAIQAAETKKASSRQSSFKYDN